MIKFSLFNDNGSNQFGTLMGSWNTTLDVDGTSKLYSSNAPGGLSLVSGQNYWLGMEGLDETWNAWNMCSPSVNGGMAFNLSSPQYGYDNQGAFTVNAQAVPEPASMAILSLGVVGVIRRRTKRG